MLRLRVGTLNIHKGVQGLGPLRRLKIHGLAEGIADLNLDLMGLQEVRAYNRKEARHFSAWPDTGQAEALTPRGHQSIYRSNAVTRHGEHGNALLSRWPVEAVWHRDVSDHRLEQRGLLHALVNGPARSIHVLVLHLGLIPGSRWRQAHWVLEHLEQHVPIDSPLIVLGDFNEPPQRLGPVWARAGLRAVDGMKLETFPARWPIWRLDQIWFRGFELHRAWIPQDRHWRHLSDHRPLCAELVCQEPGA